MTVWVSVLWGVLVFPLQHRLEEFLTAEVVPSLPEGFIQTFFNHGLGRDTGVIKSWDKQRRLSKHTIPEVIMWGRSQRVLIT